MKFEGESLEYLQGRKFSNSLRLPYDYFDAIPNRVAYLTLLSRDKKVIHLGCLDHLPLIDEKVRRRQWLHKELTDVAARCIGVDIDEETKAYVEKKYGMTNIVLGDFTTQKLPALLSDTWDFAILGEILEHIDNPVAYLQAIRELYTGVIEKIVITVPNAWTQATMRAANRSEEIINSDHRYWFTPYTLAKVVVRAGMSVDEILFANRVPLTKLQLLRDKLVRLTGSEPRYPYTYSSSIVCIARLG